MLLKFLILYASLEFANSQDSNQRVLMYGYAMPPSAGNSMYDSLSALSNTVNSHYQMVPESQRTFMYTQAQNLLNTFLQNVLNNARNQGTQQVNLPTVPTLPSIPSLPSVPTLGSLTSSIPSVPSIGGLGLPSLPIPGLQTGTQDNAGGSGIIDQILSLLSTFRRYCPLCQMLDKVINQGALPNKDYVIDASGQLYINQGNNLTPAGFSINGNNILDAQGRPIAPPVKN